MLVQELALKKKKKKHILLVVGIPVCLLRDAGNLFLSLFLGSHSYYKKDHQKKSLTLLMCFSTGGSAGRLKESLSGLEDQQAECPFSPALKGDTEGSSSSWHSLDMEKSKGMDHPQ